MSLDPRVWRQFDAKAWAERQSAPVKPSRLRRHGGKGATFAQTGVAWVIFALGVTSLALASDGGGAVGDDENATAASGEGKSVLLGKRNPKSGESRDETAVVSNNGGNGLVIRPSNTAKGGRAISATCDNDGTAADDGCAVYVNKGTGAAATFRTSGTVPFAIRDTNTGLVQFLNADRVDSMHASDIIASARQKAGLAAETADHATDADDADTLDGKDSTAFLGATAKAADADKLDGLDSSAFESTTNVQRVSFAQPSGAVNNGLLNLGGLILRASCPGGELNLEADTTIANAEIHSFGVDVNTNVVGAAQDDDFDPGDDIDIDAQIGTGNGDNTEGQIVYSAGAASQVTVQFLMEEDGGGIDCLIGGMALHG